MEDSEKKVDILFCDMVRYSQKTADMRPMEIRDFIVEYHRNLQEIINQDSQIHQEIKPSAGDGAIAIFENREGETRSAVCDRAVRAAINMVFRWQAALRSYAATLAPPFLWTERWPSGRPVRRYSLSASAR